MRRTNGQTKGRAKSRRTSPPVDVSLFLVQKSTITDQESKDEW